MSWKSTAPAIAVSTRFANCGKTFSVRPSRARYKIYIIDEVHMLTREAFNALLKTLEEPPEHVKFIFCTTEAAKIPITILSRCQRFDFVGIETPEITSRLREICDAEGVAIEDEALDVLARRAAGSMRDAQSLLEQMLSLGKEQIAASDVHQLLGTAADGALLEIVRAAAAGEPAQTLASLDAALATGVDPGRFLEQLLGWFRDLLAAAAGCDVATFQYAGSAAAEEVTQAAHTLGVDATVAAMQVIEDALNRMRYSTHGRILAEMAVVRLSRVKLLSSLPELLGRVPGSGPAPQKKTVDPGPSLAAQPTEAKQLASQTVSVAGGVDRQETHAQSVPAPNGPFPSSSNGSATPLDESNLDAVWRQALSSLEGLLVDHLGKNSGVFATAPDRLVVQFPSTYSFDREMCEAPEAKRRLEEALGAARGGPVAVTFQVDRSAAAEDAPGPRPVVSQHELKRQRMQHPLVQKAMELFSAHPKNVIAPRRREERN